MNAPFLLSLVFATSCFLAQGGLYASDIPSTIWWDGSRSAQGPAGKLLSTNEGYWGEQIDTGIRYSYETPPTEPADDASLQKTGKGRLLDGIPTGDLKTSVGFRGEELSVVFDLNKPYQITEVDLSADSRESHCIIEYRNSEDEAWTVAEVALAKGNDSGFLRAPFLQPGKARYLRLRVSATEEPLHRLSEVWIWGEEIPGDGSKPGVRTTDSRPAKPDQHFSFPGVAKTLFSDAQLDGWKAKTQHLPPLVWSSYRQPDAPWLPERGLTNLKMTALRNGGASAALVLTAKSASIAGKTLSITPLTPSRGTATLLPTAELSVAGILETRRWGATPRPLFHPSNRLAPALLNRYLLNARQVEIFPDLNLGEGESLAIYLRINANGAPAGTYRAELTANSPESSLAIEFEVLNADLPSPPVWVNSWSGLTQSVPFYTGARLQNEVDYRARLGITVWNDGLPLPGTLSHAVRELSPDLIYLARLPRRIVDAGWQGKIPKEGLDAAETALVRQHLQLLKEQTANLGIPQEKWFLELWDEPRARNVEGFAAVASLVKASEPGIPLYANPCFWINSEKGFSTDADVYNALHPWYEKLVDISVVQIGLEDNKRFPTALKLFDRGSYTTRAVYQHPSPSRKAVWQTFERGWNGWGFYSYARPRGNPWNDLDGAEFDYQFVYPGPNGPIPTLDSEAFRDCWEDFRILTLMKERRMTGQLASLFRELPQCSDNADFDRLRSSALTMLKASLEASSPP